MKWSYALFACCVLLLGFNIALLRQNRALKAQLSGAPAGFEVEAGASVPDLKGYDINGKPLTIDYGQDQRKVLVLVFSPTCRFCVENWPKWWGLMRSLDRGAVRPVGVDVTSSSSSAFLAEHHLSDIPVLLQVDPKSRIDYRFQITPQTILVDRNGKVEKAWSGVLSDTALSEIQRRAGGTRNISQSSNR